MNASCTDKCTFGQVIYVQNKYFVEKTHRKIHKQTNVNVHYDTKRLNLKQIGFIKIEKQFMGTACPQNNLEIILQCRVICKIDKIWVRNRKQQNWKNLLLKQFQNQYCSVDS